MPKVGEMYPSKFLKHDDMKGRPATLTIKEVKWEQAFGETNAVLYFHETEKAFTAKPGNARIITQLLEDDETDHWAGAKIQLTPVAKLIGGQLRKLIDVTNAWKPSGVPASQSTQAFAPPQATQAFAAPVDNRQIVSGVPQATSIGEVSDDDIPF